MGPTREVVDKFLGGLHVPTEISYFHTVMHQAGHQVDKYSLEYIFGEHVSFAKALLGQAIHSAKMHQERANSHFLRSPNTVIHVMCEKCKFVHEVRRECGDSFLKKFISLIINNVLNWTPIHIGTSQKLDKTQEFLLWGSKGLFPLKIHHKPVGNSCLLQWMFQ